MSRACGKQLQQFNLVEFVCHLPSFSQIRMQPPVDICQDFFLFIAYIHGTGTYVCRPYSLEQFTLPNNVAKWKWKGMLPPRTA